MSEWEEVKARLEVVQVGDWIDGPMHADIRAALERRRAFMEEVDIRKDSGWCGEHPRMFSLRPDADADGECLMCQCDSLRQRVEELEREVEEEAKYRLQNAEYAKELEAKLAKIVEVRTKMLADTCPGDHDWEPKCDHGASHDKILAAAKGGDHDA